MTAFSLTPDLRIMDLRSCMVFFDLSCTISTYIHKFQYQNLKKSTHQLSILIIIMSGVRLYLSLITMSHLCFIYGRFIFNFLWIFILDYACITVLVYINLILVWEVVQAIILIPSQSLLWSCIVTLDYRMKGSLLSENLFYRYIDT